MCRPIVYKHCTCVKNKYEKGKPTFAWVTYAGLICNDILNSKRANTLPSVTHSAIFLNSYYISQARQGFICSLKRSVEIYHFHTILILICIFIECKATLGSNKHLAISILQNNVIRFWSFEQYSYNLDIFNWLRKSERDAFGVATAAYKGKFINVSSKVLIQYNLI